MRLHRLLALAIVSVAVSACAGSASPNWTYAPAPSTAPAASGSASASGGPAASGSTAPASGGPSASGGPAASGSAAPASGGPAPSGSGGVGIVAQGIAFTTPDIEASADQPFSIQFDNEDAGIPHNVDIHDASGTSVFKGDIVTGVTQTTYDVPALKAGTYTFVCDVHPNMTGTLTVK
jgi:plastocyanin